MTENEKYLSLYFFVLFDPVCQEISAETTERMRSRSHPVGRLWPNGTKKKKPHPELQRQNDLRISKKGVLQAGARHRKAQPQLQMNPNKTHGWNLTFIVYIPFKTTSIFLAGFHEQSFQVKEKSSLAAHINFVTSDWSTCAQVSFGCGDWISWWMCN